MKITISDLEKEEKRCKKLEDLNWANSVKSRDDWRCVICGSEIKPNAHHIIPREVKQYRHMINNGITLCIKHHKFSRIISAHNNPLAFFIWLERNRFYQFIEAQNRTVSMLKDDGYSLA